MRPRYLDEGYNPECLENFYEPYKEGKKGRILSAIAKRKKMRSVSGPEKKIGRNV